jgi:hypothetical protein
MNTAFRSFALIHSKTLLGVNRQLFRDNCIGKITLIMGNLYALYENSSIKHSFSRAHQHTRARARESVKQCPSRCHWTCCPNSCNIIHMHIWYIQLPEHKQMGRTHEKYISICIPMSSTGLFLIRTVCSKSNSRPEIHK